MRPSNAALEYAARVAPDALPNLLPSRPIFSSEPRDGRDLVLQRVKHPPGRIDVPGLRDHLLVVHLAGPVLIEDEYGGGKRERRWSESGQVSVTPADEGGTRTLKGRTDAVLIHIRPALLNAVAEEAFEAEAERACLVRALAVPDEALCRLAQVLVADIEGGGPGGALMGDLLGRAIALQLLRRHSNLASPAPDQPQTIANGRLRRVIDFVQAHLADDLSLADLARLSGLSPSQFARGFRETTGRSPLRYVNDLRIARARDLLENTDTAVTDIGVACGFVQPSHFATMFRKRIGMSPRAWRAERRW